MVVTFFSRSGSTPIILTPREELGDEAMPSINTLVETSLTSLSSLISSANLFPPGMKNEIKLSSLNSSV